MVVVYVCACMCAVCILTHGVWEAVAPLVSHYPPWLLSVLRFILYVIVCLGMSVPHMCSARRSEAGLGSLRARVRWL